MDAQEIKRKAEETPEEGTEPEGAGDKEKGDKPKTPQTIVEANAAAEKLEMANKKHEELLARQEDMIARKILGGGSEAGQAAEKKEETPKEYRVRINKELAEGKTEFGS